VEVPLLPVPAAAPEPAPHKCCANCEKPLGKLEQPMTWEGNDVCVTCFQQLQSQKDFTRWQQEAKDAAAQHAGQQQTARENAEASTKKAERNSRTKIISGAVTALAGPIVVGLITQVLDVAGWSFVIAMPLIGVGGIVVLVGLAARTKYTCPQCKRPWTVLSLSTQQVGSHEGIQSTVQNVQVRGGSNLFDKVVANFNVPMQQRVVVSTWRTFCVCRACGHEWTRDHVMRQKA
jgi:hypothetical protein